MIRFAARRVGLICASAIAAATLGVVPAHAAIVDLSSICSAGTADTQYPNGLTVNGLQIGGNGLPHSWGKTSTSNTIQGECGIGNSLPFRIVTFAKANGDFINGISFDVGHVFAQANGAAGTLKAVFTTATGLVTVFKKLDRLDGVEPFSYTGVFSSVALNIDSATSDASYVGFMAYHINLDANAIPAVPEPATWAMMIGGFAAIGGVLRTRAMRVADDKKVPSPA